jgi:hypothetical protein
LAVEQVQARRLSLAEYRLRLGRPLIPAEAAKLRGFLGRTYEDEILLHHHRPDGGLFYEYPRVQFKVIDRAAHLVGVEQGSELVERLWGELERADLGGEELPVLEGTLIKRREALGEAAAPRDYRFLTPWLGLNQENHRRYEGCATDQQRRALLGGILVGNCLAVAGSFGHRVTLRLQADVARLRPVPTRLKGVPMVGFLGSFRINFHLPALLGLGKSVSRGFGAVAPLEGGDAC